jgi:hypothetical protein
VEAKSEQVSLEGRVISRADGKGIAGASLVLTAGDAHTISSDADGAFRFVPPRPDVYQLSLVGASGFVSFSPELGHSPLSFRLERGSQIRDVVVELAPEVRYRGLVVTATDGKPVEGARVEVRGTSDTATSDRDGKFELTAPDEALLEAHHAKLGSGRARIDLRAQISHRVVIRLRESAMLSISSLRGRVLDPEGNPAADALVIARFEPPNRAAPEAEVTPTAQVESDENGAFVLPKLDAGNYTVVANKSGFAPAIVRGAASDGPAIDLRLSRGGTLRGKVSDAGSGAPVTAFAVVVTRMLSAVEREVVSIEPTFSVDGSYRIDALPEDSYRVTVAARGFAIADEQSVQIGKGQTEASFSLGRGGTIRGVISDAKSGAAIPRARVSLEGWLGDDKGLPPLYATDVSDEAGRYSLEGIGRQAQSLLFAAAGHHARIVGGVAVPPGETHTVDVALTPTAVGEDPTIELFGIGAVLSGKGDALIIGKIVEGGGAAEAGLKPGDAILAIDGVAVTELGFGPAIQRIRGPEGSHVTLTVKSEGAKEPRLVNVPRRRIRA